MLIIDQVVVSFHNNTLSFNEVYIVFAMECALVFPPLLSLLFILDALWKQMCGDFFPNIPSTLWDSFLSHYALCGQNANILKVLLTNEWDPNLLEHIEWLRTRNLPSLRQMQLLKAQNLVHHSNSRIISNHIIWLYCSFHILRSEVAQSLIFNSLVNWRCQTTFAVVRLAH